MNVMNGWNGAAASAERKLAGLDPGRNVRTIGAFEPGNAAFGAFRTCSVTGEPTRWRSVT
jgi:hypothetical protein